MNNTSEIKTFRKYSIRKKYKLIKQFGDYVGSRHLNGYFIHLFAYEGFYVELWYLIGIDQIHWIEVQKSQEIIAEYSEKVNIDHLFR